MPKGATYCAPTKEKAMYQKFDVVIVGAGGAGLMAAMQLPNASVGVLTKVYPTRSHTGAAQGGVAAALGNQEEDHWKWHMYDTVKGGDYLVDQPAAEVLAREAIDAVYELEHRGLPFNRTPDGRIDQRRFGGHTRNYGEGPVRRSCFAADRTGHMILQTLYQQCIKHGVNPDARPPGADHHASAERPPATGRQEAVDGAQPLPLLRVDRRRGPSIR